MDGLREFPPGVLPATLDLGDQFTWEDKLYQAGCGLGTSPRPR